jgi:4-diphosphocytidyl-2-C-methyl-D-erythritol kinase
MTRAVAPAKVTLSLRVLGKRADGYHELEALTVSVNAPHDELAMEPADVSVLRVSGPFAPGVPTDETNLVLRALRLLDRSIAVDLAKWIPAGAGLGGGSADAAAVLAAFGGTAEHAAALGSDVPFCLQRSPAWMRGRGEIIEPIADLTPLELVIVAPRFGCSTPEVYAAWDALGGPRSERVIDAPAGCPGPFVNDLEPAAECVEPRLTEFRNRLEAVLERPALLCGSGSAYAAWFPDSQAAERAARRAQSAYGVGRAWHAHTIHE